ncbi:MAG: PorP/SprF family type IX secretion system membrane protein [Chitinophagales bacterium]
MTILKKLSLWLMLGVPFLGVAQDIHFSQFAAAPLQLNPALAGLNNCDWRVALLARTQWNTVSGGNTYSTFGASGDVSVGKATKFNSYAGVGFMASSDWAGALAMNTNRFDISGAYHFMLDRRGNGSLSVGLQVGINHRGFNPGKMTVDNQFNAITGQYDASLPTRENFARTNMIYIDAGLGGFYSQNIKSRHNIYLGIAANHVNQPNISWYSSGIFNTKGNERLYLKLTIHGGGLVSLNDKSSILPNFLILVQGPSKQYNVGLSWRYKVGNSISQLFFHLGAQYRVLDAVILMARVDYKAVSVGFSYDINASKLTTASASFGGPELSLVFQGCMNRKPRPFYCPVM